MRRSTVVRTPSRWWRLGLALMAWSMLACGFVGGAAPAAVPTADLQKAPLAVAVATPTGGAPKTTSPEVAAPQPIVALETIVISAPRLNQGVRNVIRVAGVADPTFEQRLGLLVRDQTGRVIGVASAQIQAATGQRGPFEGAVQLPLNLPPQPGRVIVYAISPRDRGPVQLSSVEVQLSSDAPANAALPDPNQREAIVITAPQPGATLRGSAHVVAETMYPSDLVIEVRGLNNETLGRVTRTLNNDAELPAPLIVDVPFRVTNDPLGRIVIYNLHPRDGQTIHLSSVEVNLQP